ncbi:3-hydroxybutyryl-CoA dehydrogenase [Nonomuraea sp. NPDC046570]|uniref:3-hydroxyacyl-CoA dehydrogenase n=1 Tax=Nonomuraea sp. NPDC046570 TaxID=3155255 RepID=UPI0033E6B29A
MACEMVGVVGLGTMGAGIAEVFARAGLRVVGVEADEKALERGRGHLRVSTDRALSKGRLTAEGQREILDRITLTTSRAELAEADLVVEAIPEVMAYKSELFADLDRLCKPSAILATNTSSLPVTAIAAATGRPDRVIGMHFFNPAPVMKLVEVVHTVLTGDGVAAEVAGLARRLGKTPVSVGDRAGFVVNRLLLPYLNHAAVLLEQGMATRDGIDTAMRRGAGLPMGPFALLDLIGLDTSYEVMEVLFAESRDRRHAPAPLLRELVSAGLLGRKSGKGFYDHAQESPVSPETRSAISTVRVIGPDADALTERLSAAGFKQVSGADVVLQAGGRPDVRLAPPGRLVGVRVVGDTVAEVAATVLTSPGAALCAADLMKIVGLAPVPCKDRAGGVTGALLYAHLNDAVRMYDSGYASIDDIDTAMKLGCGYPAGPFELLESIGLAKVRDELNAIYTEYREQAFAPAPLLDELVTAGLDAFPRP